VFVALALPVDELGFKLMMRSGLFQLPCFMHEHEKKNAIEKETPLTQNW